MMTYYTDEVRANMTILHEGSAVSLYVGQARVLED